MRDELCPTAAMRTAATVYFPLFAPLSPYLATFPQCAELTPSLTVPLSGEGSGVKGKPAGSYQGVWNENPLTLLSYCVADLLQMLG